VADAVVVPAPQTPENRYQVVAGPVHTSVLLLVLTGITLLGYYSLNRTGTLEVPGRLRFYLPTLIWEWLAFGYIYWGVRRHGKTFADMAGPRWQSAANFFIDLALALGTWVVSLIVLGTVSKLLHATGSVEAAKRIAPQGVLEDVTYLLLVITAGICEETIFRGYLQRQFVALFRNAPLGVLASAILFGAGHIYQGLRSAIVIVVFGLIFGILAEARRNIRPGILMHAWQDGLSGFLVRLVPK
jgi:membrane protease YdiL (CAAX protease family)